MSLSSLGWWHYGPKAVKVQQGTEYTRILYRLVWCALLMLLFAQFQVPYSLFHHGPCGSEEVFSLMIQSQQKKCSWSKFSKWSQSPVACLLVSSAEAVQGSPVLVAWGRTGFKCVFSGGGSFARARERSGLHRPLSPSRCLWLKLLCQWNTPKKL